ncbi:MAG: hypothetical protein KIT84_20695 [Labilithrix sp.]|nr:hypothetical protein [Labilithrix sp.]MCW5813460.1 hypothetical protein [Labilithrix sp.]
MRQIIRSFALAGVLAAALTIEHSAEAQTFPNPPTNANPFWIPIRRGGNVIGDLPNANADYRDIVGDATFPAAYVASDATFLYFRVRINGSPGTLGSLGNNRGYGCMIDVNNNNFWDRLVTLDGNGTDAVKLWSNSTTTPAPANASTDTADGSSTNFAANTHARVSVADSTFSSNADSFVDVAVPWANLRTGGVTAATALRFVCGVTVSATSANNLGADIFDGDASTTLSTSWSDAYTCNGGGRNLCTTSYDSDGDGVSNTLEDVFGTMPNNADSDGDGIPDFYELTPAGGGDFAAVNSDSLGPIDALDTDADNDCVLDSVEGMTTYRNASLPNANPNDACTADPAEAICNRQTGTCAGCTGNIGTGPLACPDAAEPYCNQSGPIAGQCSVCTIALASACTGDTPVCDSATGTCSTCNGDRGSAASAPCTSVSAPACQPAGTTLAGSCRQCNATNTALCNVVNPACSTETGTCTKCDAHFGAAGAIAPCPTAAAPACNVGSAYDGRCTVCSPNNTSLCTTDRPACDPSTRTCARCNGDRGSGAAMQCPNEDAPNCVLAGVDQGACKKCESSADCGPGHTGPTCDTTTGACVDVDTDGDGLQDEIEILLGTDPLLPDTDGDGIDDKTEVTPPGGGAFEKVDSDSDGTIDALDLDSDDDGIPDAEEARVGDAGPILDTDGDGLADFRDPDDDNDGIPTKDEVADSKLAAVNNDDVDGDGKKNWLDSDANNNTFSDGDDGRDDEDGDGIPNYLDMKKDVPAPEGGASSTSSSSSSSSGNVIIRPPSSSGDPDAGAPGANAEDGVLEGSGCNATGGPASSLVVFGLGAIAIGLVSRRRRLRR